MTTATAGIDPAAVEAEARAIVEAARRLGIRLVAGAWVTDRSPENPCACPATVASLVDFNESLGIGEITAVDIIFDLGICKAQGLCRGFDGKLEQSQFAVLPGYLFWFAVGRRVAEMVGLSGGTTA